MNNKREKRFMDENLFGDANENENENENENSDGNIYSFKKIKFIDENDASNNNIYKEEDVSTNLENKKEIFKIINLLFYDNEDLIKKLNIMCRDSVWSAMPSDVQVSVFKKLLALLEADFTNRQKIQSDLIDFIGRLFHNSVEVNDEFKSFLEPMFERYLALESMGEKKCYLKLLNKLLEKDYSHLLNNFEDLAILVVSSLLTVPLDLFLDFVDLLFEFCYKCKFNTNDNSTLIMEVFGPFFNSAYYNPYFFSRCLFQILNSSTYNEDVLKYTNDFGLVLVLNITCEKVKINYIHLMFEWCSDLPFDKIETLWESGNCEMISDIYSPKVTSALSGLDVMAADDAQLMLQEFGAMWDAAISSKDWKKLYVVCNILSDIFESISEHMTFSFYQDIIAQINNPLCPLAMWKFIKTISKLFGSEKIDNQNIIHHYLSVLMGISNPLPIIIPSIIYSVSKVMDDFDSENDAEIAIVRTKVFNFIRPYISIDQPLLVVQEAIGTCTTLLDLDGFEICPPDFKEQYIKLLAQLFHLYKDNSADIKGRVIEAISSIGVIFEDGDEQYDQCIFELIPQILKVEPEVSSRFADFYVRGLTRFAQYLKHRFEPYLEQSYQFFLKVMAAHDQAANDSLLVDNIKLVMEMQIALIESTIDSFHKYVGVVTNILLRMLDCQTDELRIYATNSLPRMLSFYKINTIRYNATKDEKDKDKDKDNNKVKAKDKEGSDEDEYDETDRTLKLFRIIVKRLINSREIEVKNPIAGTKRWSLRICSYIQNLKTIQPIQDYLIAGAEFQIE